MKIKIVLPKAIKESLNKIKNKTARESGYKIYTALYQKQKYKNASGYFPVPSTYLEMINARYHRYITHFINDGIIKYYERVEKAIDGDDKKYKYYDTNRGICMKYKFLVPINESTDEQIEIDFDHENYSRWYNILKNSLTKLGYDVKIKRDGFGLRVWHTAVPNYKEDLQNKDLAVIDAKCSQPRLLFNLMKNDNCIDEDYFDIFLNEKDFYQHIITKLNLTGIGYESKREEAKDVFGLWVNGKGYTKGYNLWNLFPDTSSYLKNKKNKGYKDCSSYLQRMEAKIWIDDLLNNIPTDFAIPVHDCLIVRAEDLDTVLEYCKSKYPEIRYDSKYL